MPRLDYTEIGWEDAPSTATPLNSSNLNIMDRGIAALYQDVADIELLIADLTARVEALENPEDNSTSGEESGSEDEDPVG